MNTKNYPKIYRILHWAIAISFLLLLFTIFLRLTWLNKNNVAEIIQNYLKTTDQTLSDEQAIILAKKIRNPMWSGIFILVMCWWVCLVYDFYFHCLAA
ncbi:MAG: hypothetical protein WBM13_04385 [Bacteroidia bacterium]